MRLNLTAKVAAVDPSGRILVHAQRMELQRVGIVPTQVAAQACIVTNIANGISLVRFLQPNKKTTCCETIEIEKEVQSKLHMNRIYSVGLVQ